ncbi:hypothetical protein E3N88_13530 [Mikania micrantha]|uniref:Rubisco accumulation factor 1 C-terminal domain-containing protein n=1 Tax=Mikania micrantha TaxID=192012 RepID=A0A5N6P8N7_9ASTR|nr:hypothetical protein E3N88_13530 [Mikania micrantha]
MLSVTLNPSTPTSTSLRSPFLPPPLPPIFHHRTTIKLHRTTISAIILPSSTPQPPSSSQQKLYQPFRPPLSESPIPPKYRTLDTIARLDVLTNRLGLWLLSNKQRADAARYMLQFKFETDDAQELARAIKDFPRRRGDRGWYCFDYTLPADCLAFMYYRQGLEYRESDLRVSALEKALSVAVSDRAKEWITKELDGKNDDGEGQGRNGGVVDGVKVPVVRLNLGEVAEAKVVAVFPVCGSEEKLKGVEEAPWEYGCKGDFGIVEGEKGWRRWVVLPGWDPVVRVKSGGVVVAFSDARALPWRVDRWYKEEPILVVADRGRKEVVDDDGFYLVLSEDELRVERGVTLKENGCEVSLGSVVIVVRPPRENSEYQLAEEDWEKTLAVFEGWLVVVTGRLAVSLCP